MNMIQAFYIVWDNGRDGFFYSPYGDIFGLIVVILWIWAIISLLTSAASPGAKILWLILILLLPFIGSILYFIVGPRPALRQ